jgi:hypothetical protein
MKFPTFYWTQWFITAFTSARHLSLYWASSIHSIFPHPTSWRYILILSFQLSLGLPSGLFHSGFPTKTPSTPLSSPIRATCPAISFFRIFYHPHNSGWAVQINKLLIMILSPLPSYLIPLRPKYSPQHPILKYPQPTFLPKCQRPSFTPIRNDRQNCSSV